MDCAQPDIFIRPLSGAQLSLHKPCRHTRRRSRRVAASDLRRLSRSHWVGPKLGNF